MLEGRGAKRSVMTRKDTWNKYDIRWQGKIWGTSITGNELRQAFCDSRGWFKRRQLINNTELEIKTFWWILQIISSIFLLE